MSRYFIDFEFNETGYTIEPISLGMVSETGAEMYMEFVFDEDKVREANPWVRDNVLPLLMVPKEQRVGFEDAQILIYNFLGDDPSPSFWGYFADYDWVCFCRIWGKMVDLPTRFPKYCMDLQQYYKQLGSPPNIKPEKPEGEHNAIVDARWNRAFYIALESYKTANRATAEQLEREINEQILPQWRTEIAALRQEIETGLKFRQLVKEFVDGGGFGCPIGLYERMEDALNEAKGSDHG